jgi:hypothetical protein
VVGRMRVDSGAVQCHVLTRVRVGVRVGSRPRQEGIKTIAEFRHNLRVKKPSGYSRFIIILQA